MRNCTVYLLINISLQEVFFGIAESLTEGVSAGPEEIAHWSFGEHRISNAVMIEEGLSFEEAAETVRALQESALKNPQGKTVLLNRSVRTERS